MKLDRSAELRILGWSRMTACIKCRIRSTLSFLQHCFFHKIREAILQQLLFIQGTFPAITNYHNNITINMIRAQDKNLTIAATTNDDDYSSLERIVNTDIRLGSSTLTARTRSISSRPGATTRRRVSEVSAASIESALSALSSKTARSINDEEEMDLGAILKDLRI